MEYFVLEPEENRKYCRLGSQPQELADLCYRLIEGIEIGDQRPESAAFGMSPNAGGIVAPDYVKNPFGYFIMSEKLRHVVEDIDPGLDAELLPISIVDHKGRALGTPYYIMNLLHAVDCVDRSATLAEVDALEPQFFQWIDRLVVDPAEIPTDEHVFRLGPFPKLHLVSDELRKACNEASITGVSFVPLGLEHQFR